MKTPCLFFVGLLFVLLPACSSIETTPMPADFTLQEIELFLAKKSLHVTEFEQFKVSGKRLFAECGKLRSGRNVVEARRLKELSAPELEGLRNDSWALIQGYNPAEAHLDPPGTNGGLFDPGQLFLTIRSSAGETSIRTALDSITPSSKLLTQRIELLAITLRSSTGAPLCGNRDFHGVPARRQ